MKVQDASGLLRHYSEFKKNVLYCLIANDGLGLLQSGIFESFEMSVFGSTIHALKKEMNSTPCKQQRRTSWRMKSFPIAADATLNLVGEQCNSEKKCQQSSFVDLTRYQQKIEQLNDTIVALKNQHLREFVCFQNALLEAHSRTNQQSFSLRHQSSAKSPDRHSLQVSTPSRNGDSQLKLQVELTADPHKESQYSSYDLPLQLTSKFDSSLSDLSQIMSRSHPEQDVPHSSNERLKVLFHKTLASHGYDYQKCQDMPLFASLFAGLQQFVREELSRTDEQSSDKRIQCATCAEQLPGSASHSNLLTCSKRQLEDKEREIGKRQLMLILKEKSLNERKTELEERVSDFNQKEQNFTKDIQRRLALLEEQRMQLSRERSKNRTDAQAKHSSGSVSALTTPCLQEDAGLCIKQFQLLKDKVSFEKVKREASYDLERQNDILYQNVLPGLRSLHARMKGESHLHEQSLRPCG